MCVSLHTDRYGPLPTHQNTAVVSSSTRPIVNHTDSEKVVSNFSVPGTAFGHGTNILALTCSQVIVASNEDVTTIANIGMNPVNTPHKPSSNATNCSMYQSRYKFRDGARKIDVTFTFSHTNLTISTYEFVNL